MYIYQTTQVKIPQSIPALIFNHSPVSTPYLMQNTICFINCRVCVITYCYERERFIHTRACVHTKANIRMLERWKFRTGNGSIKRKNDSEEEGHISP